MLQQSREVRLFATVAVLADGPEIIGIVCPAPVQRLLVIYHEGDGVLLNRPAAHLTATVSGVEDLSSHPIANSTSTKNVTPIKVTFEVVKRDWFAVV